MSSTHDVIVGFDYQPKGAKAEKRYEPGASIHADAEKLPEAVVQKLERDGVLRPLRDAAGAA